jgi:hypothetical protein
MSVTGKIDRIYEDASGAPAVMSCDGFMYAMDYIGGEIKTTGLRVNGTRRQLLKAKSMCEAAYRKMLFAQTTPEWRASNVALYKEPTAGGKKRHAPKKPAKRKRVVSAATARHLRAINRMLQR